MDLQEKIQQRSAAIGVIGLGYVGLPLALVFHRAGFAVTGFDSDPHKLAKLQHGESYIRHIGAAAVAEAIATGRLQATGDFDRLADMDAIIICVPTPLTEKREPDVSYIENSGREIARRLRPGQLIVLESSTYPGTTEEVLLPILGAAGVAFHPLRRSAGAAAGNAAGGDVDAAAGRAYLAYSPEREDPGNQQFSTRTIPKLVAGVDADSGRLAHGLYAAAFDKVISVKSMKTAEMAKILENTYRCVNIALVNELKQLCHRMGIDIFEVIEAAASKPFGFQPFYPGPGLGGHCIPIDPFYLSWKAREFDFATRFIELAGEINTAMPYNMVEAITAGLNRAGTAVSRARIMVLGVSYKKDIDDLRESPAIKIIKLLRGLGAEVQYHDSYCPRIHRGRQNDFEMVSSPFTPADAALYDAVIVATDHSGLDYAAIAQHARLIVDTRNACRGLELPQIVRA